MSKKNKFRNKTKDKFTKKLIYFFFIFASLITLLFYLSTGVYLSSTIDTKVWAQFGAFMGAFLLATTLIYQIRAFHRQQVEAKFFELIKYYRANIDEMKFRNPFYYEDKNGRKVDEEYVTGRRVIKTIFEQYKVARKIAKGLEFSGNYFFNKNNRYGKFTEIYVNNWKNDSRDLITKEKWISNLKINEVAYLITFWGIPIDTAEELKNYLECILSKTQLKDLTDNIKRIITIYDFDGIKAKYSGNLKLSDRDIYKILNTTDLPKSDNTNIKFFGGHQYHLGHFFRHLYQAVKYIDQQPDWLFSFDEKYDYIRTLRAQMSNYEQAVFFINSLTALGRKWEYENKYGEGFISNYHLVKNLPRNFIPDMEPHHYYPKVDFEWKDIYLKAIKKK